MVGKLSKLFLLNTGNIVLIDAGQHNIWSSNTASNISLELYLKENGNLVLRELQGTTILWQSYGFPTNTLLPNQPLTRYTNLVSSRSQSNHSSGFYKLFFDDNNVIRLDYNGPDVSSTYWPPPWLLSWEAGRRLQLLYKATVVEWEAFAKFSRSNLLKTSKRVALECVEEDRDIRPSMSQVVEMLQSRDRELE
ncbi:hypothetical protein TSUD_176270 [Trifolium subterraneum]|uniref:Bulb-type lectin domain-containing protein n=1 Tax=Trifolium subterraneum TaxID=3900 RepID=A0A2Z6P0M0_TRISU|nr:hypothetical protein TSUD_176270 [Trifolium subterraneum]